MALFASVSYILICAANIKDRWHEKGAKALIMNKLVPLVAAAILLYMIFSSDPVYVIGVALWAIAAWVASLIWARHKA